MQTCGCNCANCEVPAGSQGYHCSCELTHGNEWCKNLVKQLYEICFGCQSGHFNHCNCNCLSCKTDSESDGDSSHSSNSPRLGDRKGLCECSTGHGSHGCRNSTYGTNKLCDDCEMPTGNGEGDMGCICDCDQCEPSLPHESQWAPGAPSEPWYPDGGPIPWGSSSQSSNSSSGDEEDEHFKEEEKENEETLRLIASTVQSQPITGLNMVSQPAAAERNVEVSQIADQHFEALAVINGVAALASLPVIPPETATLQLAPGCSCKAHAGYCANRCESAETAHHLNFRCRECIDKCPSSKCICSSHVLPEGVENRRAGIGSCSNEAEQGSLWCDNCRPSAAHLENPFSGSSCHCSCMTCHLDAANWDREALLTSIAITEEEMHCNPEY